MSRVILKRSRTSLSGAAQFVAKWLLRPPGCEVVSMTQVSDPAAVSRYAAILRRPEQALVGLPGA